MLQVKLHRRLIAFTALFATMLLVPWRLTAASAVIEESGSGLPNLDFVQGMQGWHKTAMGSDTVEHPFYEVGVDTTVVHDGKPSGFVRSRSDVDFTHHPGGDGGVLRYDVDDVAKFAGKRLRWSGYVNGKNLTKHVFLFASVDNDSGYIFATSPNVSSGTGDWQKLDCVFDVPKDAAEAMFLGLRIEGQGTAYGSDFSLSVVDNSVPLSKSKTIKTPAENLDFRHGLAFWWNDNPMHTADMDYTITLEKMGGRNGGKAVLLKNKVADPLSYGTVAQNAKPGKYLGKRIRVSAYLKSENAKAGGLSVIVIDKDVRKISGASGWSTGKWIRGTQDWTQFEHVVDVPKSTRMLTFGIVSEGPGSVWVDGFKIEVLGPAQDQ